MIELALPEGGTASASWAGVIPPRRGWEALGLVDVQVLREVVASGVGEVVAGTPPNSGAHAVTTLRARIWGRPLAPQLAGTPSGVAFAADALGFLDDEPAALHRNGPWTRLTTSRGHVVARTPLLAPR